MAIDWTAKTDKIDGMTAEIFNKAFDSIQKEFDNIINGNTMIGRASSADVASRADVADNAYRDRNGNNIEDTYATKAEVGNIETALDNIIAIQNTLIGGGSV